MINRVVIITKRIWQSRTGRCTFATDFSDPYYILGLDKNADISEVKKAFYKLANENHPDKTADDPQAASKFLLIKQAYEAIKMQKGLTKPSGFVYDTDTKSMRPDSSRFDMDDEENRKSQSDYRMYQQRAEAGGQQYQNFKTAFKTVNDINDIKIRVEKGQMKDSTKRFDLENARVTIKSLSGNGISLYIIIGVAAAFYLMTQSRTQNDRSARELKQSMEAQESQQTKRRIFDQEQAKRQKYIQNIKNDQEIRQFLKQKSKGSLKRKQEIQSGEDSA